MRNDGDIHVQENKNKNKCLLIRNILLSCSLDDRNTLKTYCYSQFNIEDFFSGCLSNVEILKQMHLLQRIKYLKRKLYEDLMQKLDQSKLFDPRNSPNIAPFVVDSVGTQRFDCYCKYIVEIVFTCSRTY